MAEPDPVSFDVLPTEAARPELVDLDTWSTARLVEVFVADHDRVTQALAQASGQLAAAADLVASQLARGGRLIHVGAGTGGRLAALDAAEIEPSFGLSGRVIAALAGGLDAMAHGREFYEDDESLGAHTLGALSPSKIDVVVGVSASGRTPYVLGAFEVARAAKTPTIALVCAPGSPLVGRADLVVEIATGAEIVSGSTRLKAGDAQKAALNMMSTIAMIRLGRTYGNLMVDLVADNAKLRRRALRAVVHATGVKPDDAARALDEASGRAKVAILAILANVSTIRADELLAASNGQVRVALALARERD